MPFSACFKTERIWLSVNRDFFMQNLLAYSLWKTLLESTAIFRGDYLKIAANDAHEEVGERTIRVCGLNSVRLMRPRADILVSLHSFSQALDEAIKDYEEAETDIKKQNRKRKIREALEAIEVLANPSEKFSGFCKEYLQNCVPYHEAKRLVGE